MITKIIDKADELGWKCWICSDGDLEFEKWSPAGEDIVFYVSGANPVREVQEYARNFDADEHAEMWVGSRGKNGVPSSIRALLDDAAAIQEMLNELAEALAEVEEDHE